MILLFYLLLIFRILHLYLAYPDKEEWYTKIITLKQGDIRGKIVRPKRNVAFLREVEVFLGIPYAAPPVTGLRFMPPGAPLSWSDVLDAFYYKPVCPQMYPNLDNGAPFPNNVSPERNMFINRMKQHLKNESEDCLYMNIYVPRSDDNDRDKKNYPVILFIHGESFEWNSGNLYDGSVIAGYGEVIFVTINFRLGIFGFLKQGLMDGRANYGLSDQIAALQWIKLNIAEFGGDTSRITVMGHDTGAACVNFLMLSPVAEGLFHRAILMGGSALSPWALTETPLHYIQLASDLNCSLENNTYCFQKRRKEDIISAFKKFEVLPFESTFTPVVDEVVVLKSPAEHMEKYSLFSKYDLLAGMNEIESYYLIREEEYLKFGMVTNEAKKYLDTYIRAVFKKDPDVALLKTTKKYLSYPGPNTPLHIRNAVLDALSDMLVSAPLLQTLHYHARTAKGNYFYIFGHRTASENYIKINKSVYGDDLPYVLGVPLDGHFHHYNSQYNVREEQLSETIIRYFTNFAKTGNPNSPSYQQFLSFNPHGDYKQFSSRWPPFGVDKQPFIYFGNPPHIRYRYREEYDHFWNEILPNLPKNSDNFPTDGVNRKPTDPIENDDSNSPPINDPSLFQTFTPDNYNRYNNFHKMPVDLSNVDNIENHRNQVASAETSFTLITLLMLFAFVFLVVNIFAFIFIFYQRGKLRGRENLFRNRFRCKTVSVPDIFDDPETVGDIYAVASGSTNNGKISEFQEKPSSRNFKNNWKNKALRKFSKKTNINPPEPEYEYDMIRVASVNPEAISGKRMKRWPLSRQCSSSTITVDPHSKVRNWITHEISTRKPFGRKSKKPENCTQSSKHKSRKVSIAVDATPAARTESVLKQIPIEMTKSLDDGKSPLASQIKSSSSMGCIRNEKPLLQRSQAFVSEDSEEYYQRTGIHKSSAHIRLRTPEFLLDSFDPKFKIQHSHTRSDPSPIDQEANHLYSTVNKTQKRLKSYAESGCFESDANSASHYEDMTTNKLIMNNFNYRPILRRNYPKVLPNLPQEYKTNNRLSLPPTSSCQFISDCCSSRIVKIPPTPPPRQTATLGRKSYQSEQSSPEKQFSQLTVQLKKIKEPKIIEEKMADLIQTESSKIKNITSTNALNKTHGDNLIENIPGDKSNTNN